MRTGVLPPLLSHRDPGLYVPFKTTNLLKCVSLRYSVHLPPEFCRKCGVPAGDRVALGTDGSDTII